MVRHDDIKRLAGVGWQGSMRGNLAERLQPTIKPGLVQVVQGVGRIRAVRAGVPLQHHLLESLDGEAVLLETLRDGIPDHWNAAQILEGRPEAGVRVVPDRKTDTRAAGLGKKVAVRNRKIDSAGGRKRGLMFIGPGRASQQAGQEKRNSRGAKDTTGQQLGHKRQPSIELARMIF